MQSLLGQFYTRIRGSQEDIASEGLVYILQRSKGARLAINKILKSDCGIELSDLTYSTQIRGEKLERPDISGFDQSGKETIIFEAKFWSSLTNNQPIAYLNRLKNDSVLVFICPSLRVRSLWDEITKRINATSLNFTMNNESHSIILQNTKYLLIKTWDEILGILRVHLSQENNQSLISDIDQIIGFCEIIDSNTFLPIQDDELSPKIPKRISSYYNLIDKIVDELHKRGKFETTGLHATARRWGYIRYGKVDDFALSFALDFEYWAEFADTPFWIGIKKVAEIEGKIEWIVTEALKISCKNFESISGIKLYYKNQMPYFPLFPLEDTTEDLVIRNISEQILTIMDSVK